MKYLIYQGQHIAETLFLNMVNIQHHIKKSYQALPETSDRNYLIM